MLLTIAIKLNNYILRAMKKKKLVDISLDEDKIEIDDEKIIEMGSEGSEEDFLVELNKALLTGETGSVIRNEKDLDLDGDDDNEDDDEEGEEKEGLKDYKSSERRDSYGKDSDDLQYSGIGKGAYEKRAEDGLSYDRLDWEEGMSYDGLNWEEGIVKRSEGELDNNLEPDKSVVESIGYSSESQVGSELGVSGPTLQQGDHVSKEYVSKVAESVSTGIYEKAKTDVIDVAGYLTGKSGDELGCCAGCAVNQIYNLKDEIKGGSYDGPFNSRELLGAINTMDTSLQQFKGMHSHHKAQAKLAA